MDIPDLVDGLGRHHKPPRNKGEIVMEKKKVFKVEKRTALLDFAEGSTWHGVEARVAISVPFKELFWFQKNAQDINPENSTQAVFKFGETFLVDWNVCDPDGNPYPASGEGVIAVEDNALVAALMAAWVEAVVTPPDPLSDKSNSTAILEEMQLTNQLGDLSQSLGS